MIGSVNSLGIIRAGRVIAGLAALAFGGCSTSIQLGSPQSEESVAAASPSNLASLTDVVQRNPNDPQAYNMRGSVLGQGGRYHEALADFNKAISLDPNYAQAYANRGLVDRQTKQYDAALNHYNKSPSILPNH